MTDRSLVPSTATERLSGLRRECARVLKEIAGYKRDLQRLVAKIEATRAEVTGALAPLLDQQQAAEEELHALFLGLLRPGRLSKRKQRDVRKIYRELHLSALIGPPRFEASQSASKDLDDDAFEDLFGEGRFEGSVFDGEPVGARRAGGSSANKPSGDGKHESLRTLFKRLVLELHPDRVQHEEEKSRRTEAMKEVTQAYETADLARLMEIERRWAAGHAAAPSLDESSRAVRALEHTVRELKTQLKELVAEVRDLRRSDAYGVVRDFERVRNAGGSPLDDLVSEGQARLDEMCKYRDFVATFSAGKMTWDEFVAGPPSEEDDAMLGELLEMFEAELDRAVPRGRKKKRGKRAEAIPY